MSSCYLLLLDLAKLPHTLRQTFNMNSTRFVQSL